MFLFQIFFSFFKLNPSYKKYVLKFDLPVKSSKLKGSEIGYLFYDTKTLTNVINRQMPNMHVQNS